MFGKKIAEVMYLSVTESRRINTVLSEEGLARMNQRMKEYCARRIELCHGPTATPTPRLLWLLQEMCIRDRFCRPRPYSPDFNLNNYDTGRGNLRNR